MQPRYRRPPPQKVAPMVSISVIKALESDLKKLPSEFRKSALAASARSLAASLDDPETSATARANCARAFLDTLDRIHSLAPSEEENDKVDDLSTRRTVRRRKGAKAKAKAKKRNTKAKS